MSIQDSGPAKASVKTLAIRLEPDTHAQLSLIAQLRGHTITDEIRTAIEAHIASAKTAPELAAQAGSVLEEIERDAVARRQAISTLFGNEQTVVPAEPSSRPRGGRKAADTAAREEDSSGS